MEEVLLGMNNIGAEPNLERPRRVSTAVREVDIEAKCNIDILFVFSVSDVSLLTCQFVVLKGELPFNSLMCRLYYQYIGKVGVYWVKTMASGLNPRSVAFCHAIEGLGKPSRIPGPTI